MACKPRICGVIASDDLPLIERAAPLVDVFEVRIDLIGEGWPALVKDLPKPWIACNRRADEGGRWSGSEPDRIEALLKGIELGASLIDIELRSEALARVVSRIKKNKRLCLVSYHDTRATPDTEVMKKIIEREIAAGADICKLVTTARSVQDSIEVLKMNSAFPARTLAFAMGEMGIASRVMCPLTGGDFTYAALAEGNESAPGQLTAQNLRAVYDLIKI